MPINFIEVHLPDNVQLRGELICREFDMIQCGFELQLSEDLKYEVRGHGEAPQCADRLGMRLNATAIQLCVPRAEATLNVKWHYRAAIERLKRRTRKYDRRGFRFTTHL